MTRPPPGAERDLFRRLAPAIWAATASLLAIGLLLGIRTEVAYREQTTREAQVEADIVGASASAALAFQDRAAMQEYVGALRADRTVAVAALYDGDGRRLAEYRRGAAAAPERVTGASSTRLARRSKVVRTVSQNGASLGFVYLETAREPWAAVVARHSGLGLLTVMSVLLLGVVSVAVSQLQARARLLAAANVQLRDEMEARGRAEAALRQAQKMEALGQLTGGIAHDFNNLLQVVQSAFDLIGRRPAEASKVAQWAKNGLEAALRGAALTRQLLAFSRSQQLELKPLAVAELVTGLHEMLARTLGRDVELVFRLDDQATTVISDRTQLELAIINLAINARDAMPRGGRLELATEIVTLPEGDPLGLAPGDYVALSLSDNGEGMPPDVVERAFDPFFTTKGVGKGTGLGLSQVYGVARQAGGGARIASAPGEGAVVTLYLRRVDGQAAPTPPPARAASVLAPVDGALVLLVDDEDDLRDLSAQALELLGYRVRTASGGRAALEILERERPDVAVLDFAMPGMNGAELAALARRRWPDLPVIFASGYADTAAIRAALGGDAEILLKPFDMQMLADTVSAAHRRPRGGRAEERP